MSPHTCAASTNSSGEAVAERVCGRLAAPGHPDLSIEAGDMTLDGAVAQPHDAGDLLVAEALREQPEHLDLAAGQGGLRRAPVVVVRAPRTPSGCRGRLATARMPRPRRAGRDPRGCRPNGHRPVGPRLEAGVDLGDQPRGIRDATGDRRERRFGAVAR